MGVTACKTDCQPQQQVPKGKQLDNVQQRQNGDSQQQNGKMVDKAMDYVLEGVKDEQMLGELTQYAVDYAHIIGLVAMWPERMDPQLSVQPPITLLPSPFPKICYEQAVSVQQTLSELYYRISLDHHFLMEAYKDVVKGDPFMARLVDMMEKVHAEGIHQKLTLAIQRADYMSNWEEQTGKMQLRQVEVNIGQVGGPGTAAKVTKLHRKMLDKVDSLLGAPLPLLANAHIQENQSSKNIARGIYQAWKLFGDPNAVVVFLTQADLFPVCYFEQLEFLQFGLEKHARQDGFRLNLVKMTLKEAPQRMRLDEQGDFSLIVDGSKRVALVHLAYGYLPEHYPTEAVWKARLDMERSTAIMSPNIRVQLSGTKKIQQVMAKAGMMERFLPNAGKEKLAELRKTFAGLWGLENDDPGTQAVIRDAIQNPRKYVLKAQLGAGKGNYFDEKISEMLSQMGLEERSAYILQEKIWPLVAKNYMLRPFQPPKLETVISEMGIYGVLIGTTEDGGKLLWNTVDGYLVRSKAASVNQGGISEGSGCVDSLLLFPTEDLRH